MSGSRSRIDVTKIDLYDSLAWYPLESPSAKTRDVKEGN